MVILQDLSAKRRSSNRQLSEVGTKLLRKRGTTEWPDFGRKMVPGALPGTKVAEICARVNPP